MLSSYKKGKKVATQTAGVTEKIVSVAKVIDKEVNRDTVVTATFAGEIKTTGGTAVLHTTRDPDTLKYDKGFYRYTTRLNKHGQKLSVDVSIKNKYGMRCLFKYKIHEKKQIRCQLIIA